MKPAIIIHGNCQAGVMSHGLRAVPWIAEHYDVFYDQSFLEHDGGRSEVDAADWRRCEILFQQTGISDAQNSPALLPAESRTITFAAASLNALWPFTVKDPLFPPEPPQFPFGRYPYGDRLLIDLSAGDLTGTALIQKYDELVASNLNHVNRQFDFECARMAKVDARCTVGISQIIIGSFRNERLFWTNNHPTKALFAKIIGRLMAEAWPTEVAAGGPLENAGATVFSTWDPLDHQQVPLAKSIALHFGLNWWSESYAYQFTGLPPQTASVFWDTYVEQRRSRM